MPQPEFYLPESYKALMRQQQIAATEADGDANLDTRMLREYGIGAAELELAQEDIGWVGLGQTTTAGITDASRVASVTKARAYAIRDPLSKQAIRIWTDYSIGRGITWDTKEDNDTGKEALDEFWNDKVNKPVLSTQGQRKASDALLVDGEIFFMFFTNAAGEVRIRRVDPLEITEIITDPDDKDTPKLYRRQWTSSDNKTHDKYYPDWNNEDSPDTTYPDKTGGMQKVTAETGEIYHIAFNSPGQRGVSLLLAAMDWAKAHRKFLESRAAITQAAALFAWKAKVKGSPEQVAAMRTQLKSTLTTGVGEENNPPPASGSTWVENEGIELQGMIKSTQASGAQVDGAMLMQLFAAAVGVFPHYFGAGEAFRLATATAMERPMRVQFEAYQQLWADIWDNIFNYVFEQNKVPEDKRFVDIDFPPIVEKDAMSSINSIVAVVKEFPEMKVEQIRKLILTNLGVNNPDEVLEGMEPGSPTEEAIEKLIPALKQYTAALKEEQSNGHKEIEVPSLS